MEVSTLIRERIKYAQDHGEPLRPAYSELKHFARWFIVGLMAIVAINIIEMVYVTHLVNSRRSDSAYAAPPPQ